MLEWLIENNVVCHALEAMIFASVACSILGVIISRMSLSSIGFTMSHAAFAGAALGMFLGANAQVAAIAFSMGVAALIGPVSEKAKMAADATLGVLFSLSMAVAIFLISYMEYMGRGLSASSLLFGDVISLYREEIYALAAICALSILFVLAFYKEISAIMFNMKIAEAAGIRVKLVYYLLLFIIAISVALSLNIVGGLLIFVLLAAPASIASQFCFDVKSMFIVAPAVAL
ncbi:MAG: metal ABC transporter permease, partial [Methanothrix sp.]